MFRVDERTPFPAQAIIGIPDAYRDARQERNRKACIRSVHEGVPGHKGELAGWLAGCAHRSTGDHLSDDGLTLTRRCKR